MKKIFLYIYQCIVGRQYGFTGEGNEQWYYFLALVMNLMLVWWKKPEIAVVFTVLAVIHYATLCIYGFFDLIIDGNDLIEDGNVIFSYYYWGIHCMLAIVAISTDFKWAYITALIVIIAFLFAPDCTGNNIVLRAQCVKWWHPLIFNTIMFAVFVWLDFLLPIKLSIKLLIIIFTVIIHPIIDFLEGEGIIISDVTSDALKNIIEHICQK